MKRLMQNLHGPEISAPAFPSPRSIGEGQPVVGVRAGSKPAQALSEGLRLCLSLREQAGVKAKGPFVITAVRIPQEALKIKTLRAKGFTLIEIMIVIAIIALLAGFAIPNYLKSRTLAQTNMCINHLRQIDGAIQEWATEHRKTELQPVEYTDISPYLKGSVVCPAGGTTFLDSYSITTVSEKPVCKRVPSHVLVPDK